MLNIGIICDVNWDNFILLHNKFKKLNSDIVRINGIYGKSLEMINNCCSKNLLTLMRHYSDNLCKTVYNLLNICDIFIIFTNYIEYNTSTQLLISKCIEYNIKYIIVSEFHRDKDYYSFEIDKNLSFKKIINNLENKDKIFIEEFEYKIYNDIFNNTQHISLNISDEIKQKLKIKYENLNQYKSDKSIKLLYDKNELKKDKEMKKTIKHFNQLEFNKNRLCYYKNK